MGIGAVILDLDGVVTDTARLHVKSWKQLFDAYLKEREKRYGESFLPFDPDEDYRKFVDGRPRYKGVETFLASRKISLEHGSPEDPEDRETLCGLGNRKNIFFRKALQEEGVQFIEGTLPWMDSLRERGIRLGMATSSKNGPIILERGGIQDYFDAQVDGNVSARLQLKGKPHPDIFLECAKRLSTAPQEAAVVEDALSGVEAGRAGGFAVVIGMVGSNSEKSLIEHGADLAVTNLSTLSLEDLNKLQIKKRKS